MIVQYWTIGFYIAIGIFAICLILLFVFRFDKINVMHSYKDDEFVKRTKNPTSYNDLYFTKGLTKRYIRKYVLCKNAYDRYLICNYSDKYLLASYFVVCYDRHYKVIDVILFEEKNTSYSSRIIPLNKKTKHVNIVIKKIDDTIINKNIVSAIPNKLIRIHSFLISLMVFTGLFMIRHLLGQFVSQEYFKGFLLSMNNFILVGASLLVSLLTYFLLVVSLKKKNIKARNGGVIDYEFI